MDEKLKKLNAKSIVRTPIKKVKGNSQPSESPFSIEKSDKKQFSRINVTNSKPFQQPESPQKKQYDLKEGKLNTAHKFKEQKQQEEQVLKKLPNQQDSEVLRKQELFLKFHSNYQNYAITLEADGHGTIEYEGKLLYRGEIKNGQPNGQGIVYNAMNCYNLLNWTEPFAYIEGNFVNGMLDGECKFFTDDENYKTIQISDGIIL